MNPLVMALMAAARHRAGSALIYETTVTAGDTKIATRDGEAMFFHDSIDFSTYEGTDAGSTPYRIVLTDSSGNEAEAYGGAVGGGEALGSEQIVDTASLGTFTTLTINANSRDIDAAIGANIDEHRLVRNGSAVTGTGSIIKIVCNTNINSGTAPNLFLKAGLQNISIGGLLSEGLSGSHERHITIGQYPGLSAEDIINGIMLRNTKSTGAFDYSATWSIKPLTDIPATGLHLMSAKDGTTRNMASTDAGFNPNSITNIKVYSA